eukprot:g50831.t1
MQPNSVVFTITTNLFYRRASLSGEESNYLLNKGQNALPMDHGTGVDTWIGLKDRIDTWGLKAGAELASPHDRLPLSTGEEEAKDVSAETWRKPKKLRMPSRSRRELNCPSNVKMSNWVITIHRDLTEVEPVPRTGDDAVPEGEKKPPNTPQEDEYGDNATHMMGSDPSVWSLGSPLHGVQQAGERYLELLRQRDELEDEDEPDRVEAGSGADGGSNRRPTGLMAFEGDGGVRVETEPTLYPKGRMASSYQHESDGTPGTFFTKDEWQVISGLPEVALGAVTVTGNESSIAGSNGKARPTERRRCCEVGRQRGEEAPSFETSATVTLGRSVGEGAGVVSRQSGERLVRGQPVRNSEAYEAVGPDLYA